MNHRYHGATGPVGPMFSDQDREEAAILRRMRRPSNLKEMVRVFADEVRVRTDRGDWITVTPEEAIELADILRQAAEEANSRRTNN